MAARNSVLARFAVSAAPATLADLDNQAKGLHSPPASYGIVYRGLKNANATPWAYMLFVHGGDYLTKDGKSALNSPVPFTFLGAAPFIVTSPWISASYPAVPLRGRLADEVGNPKVNGW